MKRTSCCSAPRIAVAVLTAALLVPMPACAQHRPRLEPAARPSPAAPVPEAFLAASEDTPLLLLGAGDIVRVQVAGQPDLSTALQVADDGTLAVPFAGPVAVAGKTPAQAAQQVAAALRSARILVNPQVTLVPDRFQSQRISVLGEVATPGRLPLESRTSVFDALAQAGGTTDNAADIVYVIRTGPDGKVARLPVDLSGLGAAATAPLQVTLRGGDAVFVPRADQFYIYGEVRAANMYRLEPGMTVMQAISRGGGITARGSERRIEIRRRTSNGRFIELEAALTDRVQPGDVIRVKERLF